MLGFYFEFSAHTLLFKIIANNVLKCYFSIVYTWFLFPIAVFLIVFLLMTPSFRNYISVKFIKFINFFRKKKPKHPTMKFILGPVKTKNDK